MLPRRVGMKVQPFTGIIEPSTVEISMFVSKITFPTSLNIFSDTRDTEDPVSIKALILLPAKFTLTNNDWLLLF